MSYTALYRKFRPDNFEDVKGQDHIVTTLTNQINANRIGHAYLFCGTRGTGKTTVAKILAKAVNCEHPVNGSPCNECEMCKAIQAGTSMNVIEIDAASNNGVDNIREIREEVTYRPTEGRYKVYIIDEVHMLSTGAFNALLKTLEEPPSYVIFILATTEVHKIPITILSRCQRYDFHRISIDTIAARLSELLKVEGVEAEEKAIRYVAKAGDGSMRDALSLLDQCIAFYLGQTLTYDKVLDVLGAVDTEVFSRLLRKVLAGDVTSAIRILEELIVGGRELSQFVGDFTWYMRNLLLVKTSDNPEEAIDVSSENLKLLKEESEMTDSDTLMRYIRIFSDLSNQIRFATQKKSACGNCSDQTLPSGNGDEPGFCSGSYPCTGAEDRGTPGTAGSRTECGSTGKRSNSCAGRTAEAATEGCSGRPAEDSGKLEDDRWTDYSSFQTGVASVCAEIQWRDW